MPVLHSLRMLIEPNQDLGTASDKNGSQMPNWCMNEIAIQGDKGELKKFADKSKGKDLSLETYYPEPDYEETEVDPAFPLPGETQKKSVMPDWWNWRVTHWGTKWDLCDLEGQEWVIHGDGYPTNPFRYEFHFNTAWSPPEAAFLKISQDFPELTFVLKYAEGGSDFSGQLTVKNGEVLEDSFSGTYGEYCVQLGFEAEWPPEWHEDHPSNQQNDA